MIKHQIPISEPVHLRCEYRENPLGIDELRPRLAWLLNDPRRGARQTAYRILAATRADALEPGKADLWDTGRVESDQSNQVAYAGRPLETGIFALCPLFFPFFPCYTLFPGIANEAAPK